MCASYSNRTFWISFCVPGIKYKHRQIKNLVHNTLVGIFFFGKRERKIEREICEILEVKLMRGHVVREMSSSTNTSCLKVYMSLLMEMVSNHNWTYTCINSSKNCSCFGATLLVRKWGEIGACFADPRFFKTKQCIWEVEC